MIKVNGIDRSAFIDFGSQCTMIKESSFRELDLKLELSQLPVLKGFAFGSMHPLGRVDITVHVDFVEANIDAYVVPDEFLNHDVLLGQNLTERSEVVIHKDNTSLYMYSNIHELSKIGLHSVDNIKFEGVSTVDFTCNSDIDGHIYIAGNSCFKEGQEFILLPGIYTVLKGAGKVIAVTFSNTTVNLSKGRLLARAQILPLSIPHTNPPKEHVVNMIACTEKTEIEKELKGITMNMLNIGSDVTDEDKGRLLRLVNEYRDCFALTLNELGKTLISDDIIVEVKCPITAAKIEFIEAVKGNKIQILKYDKTTHQFVINKNSNWYFQIQGQLHITQRRLCLLGIWTGEKSPVHIEYIARDDDFWNQKMESKLVTFYMKCLLPELVDSRHTRGMAIRDISLQYKENIRPTLSQTQNNHDRAEPGPSTRQLILSEL
ncbi:hypothetical protein ACJJTC_002052 [Scirpophaga incertulas]